MEFDDFYQKLNMVVIPRSHQRFLDFERSQSDDPDRWYKKQNRFDQMKE